jgi:hypothetical protein
MLWILGWERVCGHFVPAEMVFPAYPGRPPVLDRSDLGVGMGYDGHEPDNASKKRAESVPIKPRHDGTMS